MGCCLPSRISDPDEDGTTQGTPLKEGRNVRATNILSTYKGFRHAEPAIHLSSQRRLEAVKNTTLEYPRNDPWNRDKYVGGLTSQAPRTENYGPSLLSLNTQNSDVSPHF